MSVTFTKLFASITESTVWCEPDSTRIVWITMLAMSDSRGRVWASIPGLANRARVTIEQCENALTTFRAPDRYSRTPDNEGRRIEDIDGGWRLLNHEKYRGIRDEESIKESKRRYINERRAAEKAAAEAAAKSSTVENVERGRHNAEAEADAEAENTKSTPKSRGATASRLPTDWQPSEADIEFCKAERPDIDPLKTAEKFRDYWTAKSGKEATKRDWAATWRNWVREERAPRTATTPFKSEKQRNHDAALRAIYGTPATTEKLITGEIV